MRSIATPIIASCLVFLVVACSSDEREFSNPTDGGAGTAGMAGSGGGGGMGGVPSGGFALSAPASASVALRRTASIDVSATPGNGFSEDISVSVSGLPPGISAQPLTLSAAGNYSGSLVLESDTAVAMLGAQATATISGSAPGGAMDSQDIDVSVTGAPGSLDTTFGTNGTTTFNFASATSLLGARVLPDGSVILAGVRSSGQAFAMHYFASGLLDGDYGASGTANYSTGSNTSPEWGGAAFLDDGSTLLSVRTQNVSTGSYTRSLIMLDAKGQPDTSFGTAGKQDIATGASPGNTIGTLALDSAGRIAVFLGGQTSGAIGMRTPSGGQDPNFSGSFPFGFFATELAFDASGKVLSGRASSGRFLVSRFTANGPADQSFGTLDAGDSSYKAVASVGTSSTLGAIVPHGSRVYAVGSGDNEAALVAFDNTGMPDTQFAGTGSVKFASTASASNSFAVDMLAGDQSLHVFGGSNDSGTANFFLAKFNTDGTPDTDFGSAGVANRSVGTTTPEPIATGAQPDGRLLMIGLIDDKLMMSRHWP